MVQTFSFTEAAPLISFIQKHKSELVGKCINCFYSSNVFGSISDEPLVFEFDDFVLVLHYFFYSDMTIQIIDPELFHSDETLNFLYRDIWESRHVHHYIQKIDFPYTNCKITDITVEQFSEEFEINGATGETRPDGGDYFKMITVHLENGKQFYICALDAISDGYVEIWD